MKNENNGGEAALMMAPKAHYITFFTFNTSFFITLSLKSVT